MRDRTKSVALLSACCLLLADIAFAQSNVQLRIVPQIGHDDYAIALALNRQETLFATAGNDNVVLLWDARREHILRRIEGHGARVTAVSFTPDGQLLTASADGTMRSWNVESGDELLQVPAPLPWIMRVFGDKSSFYDLAIANDGRVAVAYTNGVRVWQPGLENASRTLGKLMWPAVSVDLSADGDVIAAAQEDMVTRVWSGGSSFREEKYVGQRAPVKVVALSGTGQIVASGAEDGAVLVWNRADGSARPVCGHDSAITALALNHDGSLIATASGEARLTLCRTADATPVRTLRTIGNGIRDILFHRSSQRISAISGPSLLTWDLETQDGSIPAELRERWLALPHERRSAFIDVPLKLVRSPNRQLAASIHDHGVRVWDPGSGRNRMWLTDTTAQEAVVAAFDASGSRIAVGTAGGHGAVYDLRTGALLHRTSLFDSRVRALSWTSASRIVASSKDNAIAAWEPGNQPKHTVKNQTENVWAIAANREQSVVAIGIGYTVQFVDVRNPDALKPGTKPKAAIRALAFDDSGSTLASGGAWGELFIWSGPQFSPSRLQADGETITGLDFRPDGQVLLTVLANRTLQIWNLRTRTPVRTFTAHTDVIVGAFYSADGKTIWTAGIDGTTSAWEADSGKAIARQFVTRAGDVVTVALDGRFDAEDITRATSIGWVASDKPSQFLPVEIFTRDYFEPNLIARLLAGATLPAPRSIALLNRVQPAVRIASIRRDPDNSDRYRVSLEVENVQDAFATSAPSSGVQDVRLLRDGVVVASRDGPLDLAARQKTSIEFTGMRISEIQKSTEFSAYAFNRDGVKSATVTETFEPRRLLRVDAARERKVAVVSIGVTLTSDPSWNSKFASEDAKLIQTNLARALRSQGAPLLITLTGSPQANLSPLGAPSDAAVPTRANIRAVLQSLAGVTPSPSDLQGLPDALRAKLSPLGPDDMLVLSFSTHGIPNNGEFYLLPYDIGSGSDGRITRQLLDHSISSALLADWLKRLDAGRSLLIIDACYAQAAIDNGSFKPAPLGNRGLGQLSYDKGMSILVAAQRDERAAEWGGVSALSRALISEGLVNRKAQRRPGSLRLAELLDYAVDAVPRMSAKGADRDSESENQRPVLMDFRANKSAIELALD